MAAATTSGIGIRIGMVIIALGFCLASEVIYAGVSSMDVQLV